MKCIAFYNGYSPYFTSDNWSTPEIAKNIGGSEIATVHIASLFSKRKNTVYVFGHYITHEEVTKDGVMWMPVSKFDSVREKIDVLIIVRYINALVYLKDVNKIPKVYVWAHDLIIHNSLMGKLIPHAAAGLLENFSNHITAVGCQTEWHSTMIGHYYPALKDKLTLTPNGVSDELIALKPQKKVPHKFIYASTHSRGLENLVKIWPEILKRLPDATLVVYGSQDLSVPSADLVAPYKDSITLKDKAPQIVVFKEMQTSEVWFYPTCFQETYCMTALEAMLAGCLCIFYDVGCLKNVVAEDRGVCIPAVAPAPAVADIVVNSINNMELKTQLVANAIAFAKAQTWTSRYELWNNLIEL